MFFLFLGEDRADALPLRMRTKPIHKLYLDDAPEDLRVLMSGALTDEDGRETGSAIIFQALSANQIRAFLEQEPYHLAGLYEKTEIRPWLWLRGNPYI